MSRLIANENGHYYLKHKDMGSQSLLDMNQLKLEIEEMIQKLGSLEDILEQYDMNSLLKLSFHLDVLKELAKLKCELGVDLITLFKALKNGIWTKGGYYTDQLEKEPIFVERPEIGMRCYYDECDENYNTLLHDEDVMCIYTYDCDFTVRKTRLKDYGRTWALTKEELL